MHTHALHYFPDCSNCNHYQLNFTTTNFDEQIQISCKFPGLYFIYFIISTNNLNWLAVFFGSCFTVRMADRIYLFILFVVDICFGAVVEKKILYTLHIPQNSTQLSAKLVELAFDSWRLSGNGLFFSHLSHAAIYIMHTTRENCNFESKLCITCTSTYKIHIHIHVRVKAHLKKSSWWQQICGWFENVRQTHTHILYHDRDAFFV